MLAFYRSIILLLSRVLALRTSSAETSPIHPPTRAECPRKGDLHYVDPSRAFLKPMILNICASLSFQVEP